jgi:hypothetical protein
MAINMAQKRARKEQRRKELATLARRAHAMENSLSARVARAAQAPIQGCYLTDSIFEIGMGMLLVARGASSSYVRMSAFLIDVWSLGIKDVIFEELDGDAFDLYLDRMNAGSPLISVDPGYARKLLRDLAVWSASIGFTPHRDFAKVERIFGEVSADACDAVFSFGRESKPVYISGPSETVNQVISRSEQLQRHLAGRTDAAGDANDME